MTNLSSSHQDHQERRWTSFVGPSQPADLTPDEGRRPYPSPSRGGTGTGQNPPHQLAPTVGPTNSRGPIIRDYPVRRTTSRLNSSDEDSGEPSQASLQRARKGKAPMGKTSQRQPPQPRVRGQSKKPIYQRIGKIPDHRRSKVHHAKSSSSEEQASLSGGDKDDSSSSEAQSKGTYQKHRDTSSSDSAPQDRGHAPPPRTSKVYRRHPAQAVPKKKVQFQKAHPVRDLGKPRL